MYKYAATDSIFDGVSNIYLISIATAFLAVIIAFYCSNFLKDESEKQLKQVLNDVGDEEEEDMAEQDDYLNDSTTEIENHYQLKQEIQKRLILDELENTSDYEDNDAYKNVYAKSNSTSTNEDSDADYDMDEMHVDGLVSKIKSKRVKELEAQLTRDQLEEEKRIEREQLAAIFELLKKQEAELNMKEIDESELNAQLALYR
ncbi:ciliogenesis-associated TTC17-interacting protein [Calliphora vicina]|uniref:ciliogenesis-associated TTC17-interacting protein n=1 Tax=Calliphora vicina TaxID=7373 RepID=UPI00325A76BB